LEFNLVLFFLHGLMVCKKNHDHGTKGIEGR
jgi:hypothetical protein